MTFGSLQVAVGFEGIVRSLKRIENMNNKEEENHPPPDLDFCARCHEHTGFEWDEEEEWWISECCGVWPVSVE